MTNASNLLAHTFYTIANVIAFLTSRIEPFGERLTLALG